MKTKQLTDTILMIRPAHFAYNEETALNNTFQKKSDDSYEHISKLAKDEFDQMVSVISNEGIEVVVIDDTPKPIKPDAVFPNNWISFHDDGTILTYPMNASSRRLERREDIIEYFNVHFKVSRRLSLEIFEHKNQFLEGTGSMILDRKNKIVYACLSPRTHIELLHHFSLLMDYKVCFFKATDQNGIDIYHTNVLMALGVDFVVCCMQAVEPSKKEELESLFVATGKELVDITFDQMNSFAGNMLQLCNHKGDPILVLSRTAYNSLTKEQLNKLSSKTKLLPVEIPTIESIGGGSARCMIAEVFLKK